MTESCEACHAVIEPHRACRCDGRVMCLACAVTRCPSCRDDARECS